MSEQQTPQPGEAALIRELLLTLDEFVDAAANDSVPTWCGEPLTRSCECLVCDARRLLRRGWRLVEPAGQAEGGKR